MKIAIFGSTGIVGSAITKEALDGKGIKYGIAVPDMAKFVVAQLADSAYMYETPVISN